MVQGFAKALFQVLIPDMEYIIIGSYAWRARTGPVPRSIPGNLRMKGFLSEKFQKSQMKKALTVITFILFFCLAGTKPVSAAELTNQFTISTWVKAETSVATRAIAVKNNEVRLVTDASGFPLCQVHNGTAWQTAATSTTAIAVNTWAQVTCTYDKVTLRIFVNGVQTGTQALTVSLQDTANVLKFGQDDGATYADLAGTVDDIRIYNYARTPGQIIEDM